MNFNSLKCEPIAVTVCLLFFLEPFLYDSVGASCGSSPDTEGRYGVNCSQLCSCSSNAVCNDTTGECTGRLCGNTGKTFTCDKNGLTLVVIGSPLVATEMTSVTITCISNLGPGDILITWRDPSGAEILPGSKFEIRRESDTVNVLALGNTTSKDSGTYTCVANLTESTDILSTVEESTNITIFARDEIFEYPNSVVKRKEGEMLRLTCKAFFASQLPSLQWLFNSEVLSSNEDTKLSSREEYYGENDVILIRSLDVSMVAESHNGTYQCLASQNNIEKDVKNIHVFIVDLPVIADLHLADFSHNNLHFRWRVAYSGNDNLTCTIRDAAHGLSVVCDDSVSCNTTNLSPYTTYNVSLVCQNYAGFSNVLVYENAQTAPSAPSHPNAVMVFESATHCNISWTEPLEVNGPGPLHYQVQSVITPRGSLMKMETLIISDNIPETLLILEKNQLSFNSVYSFKVTAANDLYESSSSFGMGDCTTPRSAPDIIPDLKLFNNKNSVSSTSVMLASAEVDTRNGPISCYEFVVMETNGILLSNPDEDIPPDIVVNQPSDAGLPYRAVVYRHDDVVFLPYISIGGQDGVSTGCHLSDSNVIIRRAQPAEQTSSGSSNGSQVWSIGNRHTKKRSIPWGLNTTLLLASNSPLKEQTNYVIFLRTYSILDDGSIVYMSSRYLSVTTSNAGLGTLFVIIIVILVVILLLVAFSIVFIWRLRRGHSYKKKTIRHDVDATYMNDGYTPSSYLSLPNYYSADSEQLPYMPMAPVNADIPMAPVNAAAEIHSKEGNDISGSHLKPATHNDDQSIQASVESDQNTPDLTTTASDQRPDPLNSELDTYGLSDRPSDGDTSGMEGKCSVIMDINIHEQNSNDSLSEQEEIAGRVEQEEAAVIEPNDDEGDGIVVHSYYEDSNYEEIPNGVRKHETDDYSHKLYNDWAELTHTKVSELQSYVEYRKRLVGANSLRHEFAMLPQGQQEPWNVAVKPENLPKSPFPDILPYDYTRLKLPKLTNDPFSDFYNASFITDQFNKTTFIAAQGPSSDTVDDFWRMIWLEKVKVIVMVTSLQDEAGQDLCYQYWPDSTEQTQSFGTITVEVESIASFANYEIKKLLVQKEDGEAILVSQFIFLSWPHLKVPKKMTALLSFVKMVKDGQRANQVPLLVHCSDGAGATGTFLAIYCLLDDLSDENEISVFEFVKRMRKNRIGMVQSEDQYMFVYDILLEEYLTPKTELTHQELLDMREDQMVSEFQALPNTPCHKSEAGVGKQDVNKCKNGYPDKITDKSRLILCSESLMSGNDYINASLVDSFLTADAFICTQSPLPTTVEDFWRLVFEYRCTRIIMLNKIDGSDKHVPYYWPRGGTVQYGSITVESIESQNTSQIARKFLVSHMNTEEVLPVEHCDMSPWQQIPDMASKLKEQLSCNSGPVLVHCLDGCSGTGIYLTTLHELQRLQCHSVLNVHQSVKELQEMLPFAVQSVDDYVSIYKILQELVASHSIEVKKNV
ncbi:uncharacterized protein [Apostichopus japonicus]|uniref:uncharacterized protein isoform X2 n=1 Tax=Stichopus japonicus TaxID=307972 RepID=UPI003AB7F411